VAADTEEPTQTKNQNMKTLTKLTFAIIMTVLFVSAMSAQAKLGETKAQIIKRFGADALISREDKAVYSQMEFGRKNYVRVIFNRYGRSDFEIYMLKTPYSASDANEIVSTVLGGVHWRWSQIDDRRTRSHDGVYELVLVPGYNEYRWGIAVGYTAGVDAFAQGVDEALDKNEEQLASTPAPSYQPASTPRYYVNPSRTPNDCAIVAAQAYAKLKPNTYWCQIMSVHVETTTEVVNHAMVFYKYQANGHVLVYDARGTLELNTTSEQPDELAEAVKPAMQPLTGSYPTTVVLSPLTYDDAQRFQPSVTSKAPTGQQTLTDEQAKKIGETIGYVIGYVMMKMLIGGGIGYLIGRSKNRPWFGFWWGTVVGAIGWIVTVCMRKNEVPA
jgi:hypothetical protein